MLNFLHCFITITRQIYLPNIIPRGKKTTNETNMPIKSDCALNTIPKATEKPIDNIAIHMRKLNTSWFLRLDIPHFSGILNWFCINNFSRYSLYFSLNSKEAAAIKLKNNKSLHPLPLAAMNLFSVLGFWGFFGISHISEIM